MFKLAFEILIKAAMSEHIYSFNGDLRKQAAGEAIGNVLTGSLGVLYTVYWCKEFLDKVKKATEGISDFCMYLLKIYVDDQTIMCEVLPPGARLVDRRVCVVDSEVEGARDIPSDIRTLEVLLKIANGISTFIQLTSDCPSSNTSGFMPLLDIQVKVVDNKLIHTFYKKPVSNPLLITKNSAMPFRTKKASLSCEALRRLRNCSRELPWTEKAAILSEFSHKLMISGWDAMARHDFIMAGLIGYQKQLERADAGVCPLYRPWYWDREARDRKNKAFSHELGFNRVLLRAGEVPGLQIWTEGLLSHKVGRPVSHHLQGVCQDQHPARIPRGVRGQRGPSLRTA